MLYGDVILPLPLEGYFTYSIPQGMQAEAVEGVRVLVPFGRNKSYVGILVRLHDQKPEGYEVKNILQLIDRYPILLEHQYRLWQWIADYYLSPIGEVYKAALPAGLKAEEGYKPRTETYIRLTEAYRNETALHIALNLLARAPKQQEAFIAYLSLSGWDEYDFSRSLGVQECGSLGVQECGSLGVQKCGSLGVQECGSVGVQECRSVDDRPFAGGNQIPREITREELMNDSGCTLPVLNQLVKRGMLETYEVEVGRLNNAGEPHFEHIKPLSLPQQQAYNEILFSFLKKNVTLLHGVTSSGKTEIYIHLIQRELEQHRQVLYLLPEIALTVQMMERLQRVFGNRLGIYHSKYSDAERVEIWQKQLSANPYDVILGARSAVFLPFQRLGLIIVDEEHETSYKQQDPAPRYHARSAAIMMAAPSNLPRLGEALAAASECGAKASPSWGRLEGASPAASECGAKASPSWGRLEEASPAASECGAKASPSWGRLEGASPAVSECAAKASPSRGRLEGASPAVSECAAKASPSRGRLEGASPAVSECGAKASPSWGRLEGAIDYYKTAHPCSYALLKKFSTERRNQPTEAEKAMWEILRSKNLGDKFRREHVIGDFIVDFICLSKKIVIEVDGGYHFSSEQKEADKLRTAILRDLGYKELRFTNEEVLFSPDKVLSVVCDELSAAGKASPSWGRLEGAKVLLGTATPSLESYHNARIGKYGLVELKERYKGIELPEIQIVDTKDLTRRKMMHGPFSPLLLSRVREALERGEQAILFQNRRGYVPMIECRQCGWVPRCEHCDVSLTLHKSLNQLTCHYCGATYAIPTECPACGGKELKGRGYGTEKIEDQIRDIFPEARISRMDLDTTRTRNAYERIISDFASGRTNLLIGTQMISKGLDFDRVSVVGILDADAMLSYPDFRAYEQAFMMMAQVSGRAGRRGKRGLVILQTKNPDLSVIHQVVRNDYHSLYSDLIAERQAFSYPPYYRLIYIYLKHKHDGLVNTAGLELGSRLRQWFGGRVLGPDKPPVARVKTLSIRKIVLKLENGIDMPRVRQYLRMAQQQMLQDKRYSALQIYYDVDPL